MTRPEDYYETPEYRRSARKIMRDKIKDAEKALAAAEKVQMRADEEMRSAELASIDADRLFSDADSAFRQARLELELWEEQIAKKATDK